jgi:hypothetical protein
VGATWPLTNDARRTSEGHNFQSRAGFEHGGGWKTLDEQKVMEISRRGSEMMEESEILMPHP